MMSAARELENAVTQCKCHLMMQANKWHMPHRLDHEGGVAAKHTAEAAGAEGGHHAAPHPQPPAHAGLHEMQMRTMMRTMNITYRQKEGDSKHCLRAAVMRSGGGTTQQRTGEHVCVKAQANVAT